MITRVMLFGSTGAAKSTLCAMICHYFHEAPGYSALLNSVDNKPGASQIIEWRKRLIQQRFPDKTNLTTFTEVDIGFRHATRHEQAAFSFLEIAGENVVVLDPLHPKHGDVDPELGEWLRRADIILLVGSAVPQPNDRFMMQTFLEYLEHHEIRRPLAFVVTEWDRIPPPTRSVAATAAGIYPEAIKSLRNTDHAELFTFSVGRVSGTGPSALIDELDFRSGTERLVSWLLSCLRHTQDS